MNYPKKPDLIPVRIIDRELKDGIAGKLQEETDSTLDQLMGAYLTRMGFGNAHLGNIIVHLLFHGKVRVDFALRSERVELLHMEDRISQPQAMALFDDYIKAMQTPEDKKAKSSTMRIEVQKPRQ